MVKISKIMVKNAKIVVKISKNLRLRRDFLARPPNQNSTYATAIVPLLLDQSATNAPHGVRGHILPPFRFPNSSTKRKNILLR